MPQMSRIENFSKYTEYDEGSDVSVAAHTITFTNARPSTDGFRVFKDKGVAYFNGNFEHYFRAKITAVDLGGGEIFLPVWMLANSVGSWMEVHLSGSPSLVVSFMDGEGNPYGIQVEEDINSNQYSNFSSFSLSVGTEYFFTVKRDESVGDYGTLYVYICTGNYKGKSGSSLLDTLSLALYDTKVDFRYIYGLTNYEKNPEAPQTISGDVKDLQLVPSYTPHPCHFNG